MFRTLLLAVLSVLALSTIAVGTAQAASPVPTAEGGSCTLELGIPGGENENGVLNSAGVCVKVGASVNLPPILSNPSDRDTEAECEAIPGTEWYWDGNSCERRYGGPGGGNDRQSCSDYNRAGIYDIPRGDPRYRDYLDRDGDGRACERNEGNYGGPIYNGPRYNSCDEYRTHNMRDFRRGDSRWNDSWDRNRNGIACDNDDVIVVDRDGDCVTYALARDSIRSYNNDYNSLRSRYNNDWNRTSPAERSNLRRLYDQSSRYRGDWDRLGPMRTVCKDTTPPLTIINEAPPIIVQQAPPLAAPSDNPAPYGSSGGQVSRKPSGAAETGDGSTQL